MRLRSSAMRSAADADFMAGFYDASACMTASARRSAFLVRRTDQDLIDVDVGRSGDAEDDGVGDIVGLQLAHARGPLVQGRLGCGMSDVVAQFGFDDARFDAAHANVVGTDFP